MKLAARAVKSGRWCVAKALSGRACCPQRAANPAGSLSLASACCPRRAADSAPYHRAFTLIELLLTLVVLMLLLGAVVMSFTGLQSSSQLDEGVEQFESLVRYARAHAANSGCRVRFTFEEVAGEGEMAVPLGNVFATWEPDPLNKPGEFHPLQDVAPLLETMLRFVEVDEVRPVGDGLPAPTGATVGVDAEQTYGFEPITFYPDGSSDTAEVIFSARESDAERQMAVQIIGATGTVRKQAIEMMVVEQGGASEK